MKLQKLTSLSPFLKSRWRTDHQILWTWYTNDLARIFRCGTLRHQKNVSLIFYDRELSHCEKSKSHKWEINFFFLWNNGRGRVWYGMPKAITRLASRHHGGWTYQGASWNHPYITAIWYRGNQGEGLNQATAAADPTKILDPRSRVAYMSQQPYRFSQVF